MPCVLPTDEPFTAVPSRGRAVVYWPSEQWISLSGADPLNLVGVLTPGPRLAALTDNRLIYRDGIPVATLSAGKVEFLTTLDAKNQWEAEKRLMRSAARGLLSHLS